MKSTEGGAVLFGPSEEMPQKAGRSETETVGPGQRRPFQGRGHARAGMLQLALQGAFVIRNGGPWLNLPGACSRATTSKNGSVCLMCGCGGCQRGQSSLRLFRAVLLVLGFGDLTLTLSIRDRVNLACLRAREHGRCRQLFLHCHTASSLLTFSRPGIATHGNFFSLFAKNLYKAIIDHKAAACSTQ